MMWTELRAEFTKMAVEDPLIALLIGLASILVVAFVLMAVKALSPNKFFTFGNIGRRIRNTMLYFGGAVLYMLQIPKKLLKAAALAKVVREEKRYKQVKAEARKLVSEMPKIRVEVRGIDAYTYCYDCDIHYNKKLPECPNCFAQSLAEGDAKAIFSVLKGVREFRYLSFDREQDLIKLVCEKMVGDTVDDFGKKE